jgi:hypothetical protein
MALEKLNIGSGSFAASGAIMPVMDTAFNASLFTAAPAADLSASVRGLISPGGIPVIGGTISAAPVLTDTFSASVRGATTAATGTVTPAALTTTTTTLPAIMATTAASVTDAATLTAVDPAVLMATAAQTGATVSTTATNTQTATEPAAVPFLKDKVTDNRKTIGIVIIAALAGLFAYLFFIK